MTDSPTPRRHRGSRRAPRRSRGLVGPVASALSVLLAIGPVVWLMSRDSSTVDGATKVLNVSEDTRQDDAGRSVVDGTNSSATPDTTVTKTLPNGATTIVTGTPALGSAASTLTSDTPAATGSPSGTPDDTPTNTVTTAPTGSVTTVTVSPTASRTTKTSTTPKPQPTKTTPTKTETSEPRPSETTEPPAGGGGTNAQEREVLNYTNQIREHQGCGPLRLDSALVEAAGRHASDMVRRHYMDHTNPDGQDPGDRMAAAGYRGSGWGENIAAGYESAQEVVAAWMKSEGHRKNILNCRFTSIGIGYDPGQVKSDWGPGSWVQDFGRN
ncbi:CAP domain-containing protein [Kribbella sp. NPDC023972]|uniref:CAP domain-containing protein n=1 Tax=Kribbella sp. NPDC023972 TaxID=3154795 RepID=UPI0033E7CCB4